MPHNHEHHQHTHGPTQVNNALVIGIVLNFAFVLVEVFYGLATHSLSLLSDAGHNLADVASLGLSLLAFRLLKVRPNNRYTYGYRKTSILVALFNAVVLLLSVGAISYEAIQRFFHPEPLPGKTIALVAGIGIVINTCTGLLFFRNREKDLNIRSAYLHLMSDALVSLALVVGGIVIVYTGWYWIDPVLSLLVAIVITFGTWQLLRDSLRLSLDGTPGDISVDETRALALKIPGVVGFHHIHIWAISTTENALTGHLVLSQTLTWQEEQTIKENLRHALADHQIRHATLETERDSGEACAACR